MWFDTSAHCTIVALEDDQSNKWPFALIEKFNRSIEMAYAIDERIANEQWLAYDVCHLFVHHSNQWVVSNKIELIVQSRKYEMRWNIRPSTEFSIYVSHSIVERFQYTNSVILQSLETQQNSSPFLNWWRWWEKITKADKNDDSLDETPNGLHASNAECSHFIQIFNAQIKENRSPQLLL